MVLWGHAVQVFAAVMLHKLEFKFSDFGLGGLPCRHMSIY